MLLILALYPLTGELFYTSIVLSVAVSLGALLLFAFRLAGSIHLACLGVAVFTVSRAFTDYSTSGLENPLTHLLLGIFLWIFLAENEPGARDVFLLSLIAALMGTARMDALLIMAPALALTIFTRFSRGTLLAGALGAVPLLAWELFSLFYYGFPFPNTAYAKLNTGLGTLELARRGIEYLQNSLLFDPLTLVATAAGISVPLVARRWRAAAIGTGIALYLLYVVLIGGDFMSGRFLTAPLFAALVLCCRFPLGAAPAWVLVAAVAIACGLLPPYSPFFSAGRDEAGIDHPAIDANGIADERAVQKEVASLLRAPGGVDPWPHPGAAKYAADLRTAWEFDPWMPRMMALGVIDREEAWPPGALMQEAAAPLTPVAVRGNLGYLGFHAGPGLHILDFFALADPLLARLPALERDPLLPLIIPRLAPKGYRVGHFVRKVPPGYVETLMTGQNRIRDRDLAAYYDALSLVTRGPLLDRRRLAAIRDLNTGRYNHLLAR
jgi:arabinofuranosyltransferase